MIYVSVCVCLVFIISLPQFGQVPAAMQTALVLSASHVIDPTSPEPTEAERTDVAITSEFHML